MVFKDGELVQGVLDKKSIGPSAGGWVNAVYEVYGHTVAGRLLSVLGRLLTKLEGMRGFSCGVQDLIFTREGEVKRREALEGAGRIGTEVARKYVGLDGDEKAGERELRRRLEDVLRDVDGTGKQQGLDQLTNSATALSLSSAVTTACLPSGLTKPFPANQMQLMTSSGAKGSKVNANQISCNLGQQVLEGRRVPIMVSGKSLPCFAPFETSVRAGGYIVDRFLTGLRPQEAFFHAMAGREGLIDTAVKTSRSGYLQRCLIKGMEGLKVEYDTSVRDADGSVVQFLYGEDGLDVAKSRYLSDFKFAGENYVSLFNGLEVKGEFDRIVSADASEACRKAEKAFRRSGGDLGASEPGLSLWPPAKFAGSISEKLLKGAREYVDSNPDRLIRDKKKGIEGSGSLSKRNFNAILDVRYLKSVVEAGEAVGVVAGQSVGEPSTQMTLNTFHLAGHSAKNVTLGIPRLREIVMTAARNIATPTMTLKVNEGVSVEDARKFAKGVSRLSLAEVVEKVTVTERQGKGRAYAEARVYEVKVDMFGKDEYMKEYAITSEDVVATLEHRFLPRLQALARKELKKRGEEKSLKGRPEVGKSVGGVEMAKAGGEEGGDDGEGDSEAEGDASGDKDKANKTQAGYEALEDEEEVDIAARARREPSEEDETYGGSPKAAAAGDDDSESEIGEEEEERLAMRSAAKDREQRILASRKTNDVVSFAFDDKTGASCTFSLEYDAATAKILMLHLVELAAHAALIQSVPGISLAMLDEAATFDAKETNPSKQPVLATSGVNIPAMWDYQHIIHPHTLYTNSISTLLLTYGVECARSAIVLELQSVFGGHGISVDLRHLTLIADFMTRGGGYEAFSRMGYRSNVSPFMKMSFETTVGVLREAVLGGEVDGLEGPSARIVVGRLGRVGTGGFDVFLPVKGEEGQGEGVKDEGVGEDEMSE